MNTSLYNSNLQTDFVGSSYPQGQNTVQSTSTLKEPTQIPKPSQQLKRESMSTSNIYSKDPGMPTQKPSQRLKRESMSTSNIYSKDPRMNFANPEIEHQFKNLRIENTKNSKKKNNKISRIPNMKEKSHTTMLRSYSNGHPQTSSSMHTNMEPSDFSFNTQNQNTVANTSTIEEQKEMFEPSRYKCGGRGIQQVAESINHCSKNLGMNFANPEIEHQFKNLRIENTKNHKEENNKISRIPNMKGKSHKTKLRGNPMLRSYFNDHPQTSSSMHTDMEPSDFYFNAQNQNKVANTSTIEEPKQMFEPSRYKCGGRGMIIQQVAESINHCSKNLGMSYSNTSIERHFKNLREKAKKEHDEENEKIWGPMLNSNKNN